MATIRVMQESEAKGRVREIFDEIKETKQIDAVPAIWRALANHPGHLETTWRKLKGIMHQSSNLDLKTKEMLALAVSITNGCTY